jgi:hypothetical protein
MSNKPCWLLAVLAVLQTVHSALAQQPRSPLSARTGAIAVPAAGKFLAIPGLFPLSMSGVQREIGLTGDQKQQLKGISDRYAASLQQIGAAFERLDADEKQKQGKDFNEQAAAAARNAQRKAEAVLAPQQLQAVKKIAFDLSATLALADPKTQERIGLNVQQRQRLKEVFDQAGEKMQQLQRDTAQRTMEVLDEEQAAALKAQMSAAKKPE